MNSRRPWRVGRACARPVVLGRRAALVVAVGVLSACSSGATGSDIPSATRAASSPSFADAVGPLFLHGTTSPHGCTASVVASTSGDIALTAAHCLSGTAAGVVFVPGYQDGRQPFGAWSVVAAYAPAGWLTGHDIDDDVAFMVLAPHTVDGIVTTVQQAAGAATLGTAAQAGHSVTVVAYDAGIDDAPVQCATTVREGAGEPTFDCHGFVAGSSGGPWLVPHAGGMEVVGLIGGFHQGGCKEQTSHSPVFGSDIADTLARADRNAGSDTLPAPPDDGC